MRHLLCVALITVLPVQAQAADVSDFDLAAGLSSRLVYEWTGSPAANEGMFSDEAGHTAIGPDGTMFLFRWCSKSIESRTRPRAPPAGIFGREAYEQKANAIA